MRTARGILLVCAALGTVSGAAAQNPDLGSAALRGDRSLLVEVGGGFGIGYWTRRSARTDAGLEVGFSYEQAGFHDQPDRSLAVALSPALKTYLAPRRSLAPYRYLGVGAGYSRSESRFEGYESIRARAAVLASAGLGLEWFPIPDVSIGGHAGFSSSLFADVTRQQIDNQSRQSSTVGGFRVSTFTSGLRLHLYF